MIRSLAAEFVGTFFLVLLGPGAVMVEAAMPGSVGSVGVALAFGCAVIAIVYALAPISGAHINPAALAASVVPGLRATKVDPMEALRAE